MAGVSPEYARELLRPDGPLSHNLSGFELRPQQIEMMETIIKAYNENGIALIEAGTGTGKSIAYLLPAILFALRNKERTVISTNTINLQEQLLKKDLPTLLKAFNFDVKAVLVKGVGNYLCLRKLQEALEEKHTFADQEAEELEQIEAWSQVTKEGSKSDLPSLPSYTTWERVNVETDLCTQNQCPYYQQCHFFKARRQAQDAQILIVNHHLLFADLAIRSELENFDGQALLPPFQRLVIDEAHHIEDVATEYLAERVHFIGMLRTLARVASESHSKSSGKLSLLREKIVDHFRKNPPRGLMGKLNLDLPGMRREVHQLMGEAFTSFYEFLEINEQDQKLRLRPHHHTDPIWNAQVLPQTQKLISALYRFIQTLHGLKGSIEELEDDRLNEKTHIHLHDIASFSNRLTAMCETLEKFTKCELPDNAVRWIEGQPMKTMTNVHLVEAGLNMAQKLADLLFKPLATVILCSATLATNREFTYIRQRLGLTADKLPQKKIFEALYDSAFDYQKQSLLAIPTSICEPTHVDFPNQVQEHIMRAIRCSRGNAFILFTSYSLLKLCYSNLAEKLTKERYLPLKQGDMNRDELIRTFRNTDRSVLFGTDSFWEGVDVAGEALRLVIIVRLPFQVPTEPVIQARTELMEKEGKNPFYDYSIPNAIVKFKQGFGRLIRNKNDRGCILCLDSRLQTKPYGKLFLNSLPNCQRLFASDSELYKKMEEFYKSTYYLVKR
jgi:ATP-dependent DNA helicase DinG